MPIIYPECIAVTIFWATKFYRPGMCVPQEPSRGTEIYHMLSKNELNRNASIGSKVWSQFTPPGVYTRVLRGDSEDVQVVNLNHIPQVVVKNPMKAPVFLFAYVRKYYDNFGRLNNYVVYKCLNSEPDRGIFLGI